MDGIQIWHFKIIPKPCINTSFNCIRHMPEQRVHGTHPDLASPPGRLKIRCHNVRFIFAKKTAVGTFCSTAIQQINLYRFHAATPPFMCVLILRPLLFIGLPNRFKPLFRLWDRPNLPPLNRRPPKMLPGFAPYGSHHPRQIESRPRARGVPVFHLV